MVKVGGKGNKQFDGMSEMSNWKKNDDSSSMGSGMVRGMIMDDDSSTGGFHKKIVIDDLSEFDDSE